MLEASNTQDLKTTPASGLTVNDDDLLVTQAAREKIAELIADADDDIQAVRVFVAGGGCSGMNYGMTFSEGYGELDSILEDANGFKMVVDPVALTFLQSAEIDFVDDGLNASFVFNNVFQSVGGSGACSGCAGAGF